jgi:hypothetical protein
MARDPPKRQHTQQRAHSTLGRLHMALPCWIFLFPLSLSPSLSLYTMMDMDGNWMGIFFYI